MRRKRVVESFFAANLLLFGAIIIWIGVSYWAQPDEIARVEVPSSFEVVDSGVPDEGVGAEFGGFAEDTDGALSSEPRSPSHVRASEAFRDGRLEQAVEFIERGLMDEPDNAGMHNDLGVYRIKQGRFSDAIASLRNAVRLEPDYAKAQFNLGTALLKQGDLAGSVAALQKAIELRPHYTEARYNLARALTETGDLQGARDAYRFILEGGIGASSANSHHNLGVIELRSGELRESLASFTAALRLRPDLSKSRYNKALVLTRLGFVDEGLKEYRKLIDIDEGHQPALVNIGVILMRRGEWGEACDYLQRAVSGDSSNGVANYDLGLCFVRRGDDERAIAHFESAIRANPGHGQAYYNLALALQREGRHEEGQERFRRAVELRPERPEYHYNFALSLARAGSQDEAAGQYRDALRLDPEYFKARYNLGLYLFRKDRYELAARQFENSLASRPDSYEASYNLGLSLLKLGRASDAADIFRSAVSLEDTVEARYNLGLALVRAGRLEDSVREFRAALRSDPKHVRSIERVAETLNELGEHEAALNRMLALQRLVPKDPTAFNAGLRLYRAKSKELALRYFAVAVRGDGTVREKSLRMFSRTLRGLSPSESERALRMATALAPNHTLHRYLGAALADQDRGAEAAVQFQKALALQPDDPQSLKGLATERIELDQHELAFEPLVSLQSIKSKDPTAYNAGLELYRERRYPMAVRFLDLASGGQGTVRRKGLIMAGLARERMGQLDAASRSLRTACKEFPDHHPGCRNLARVLGKLGRFRESLAIYGAVLATEPNNAAALYGAAVQSLALGDDREGVALLLRTLEQDPNHAAARAALARHRTKVGDGKAGPASPKRTRQAEKSPLPASPSPSVD